MTSDSGKTQCCFGAFLQAEPHLFETDKRAVPAVICEGMQMAGGADSYSNLGEPYSTVENS
jgi:hypothetical protein